MSAALICSREPCSQTALDWSWTGDDGERDGESARPFSSEIPVALMCAPGGAGVLGLVRARRVIPVLGATGRGAEAVLESARSARVRAAAAARAEAAWLEGRAAEVAEATDRALNVALERDARG